MSRLLVLVSLLSVPAFAGAPVTIKGSDTMVILTQRWAETFMKKKPEVKLQVTGGGSGTGLAALISGSTDLATSSRSIKDAEKAKLPGVVEVPVARDGVTFFVHESNPVQALTVEQLKGIYLGDITNWKDVGGPNLPIALYSRESSSGTYVFVKEHVLGNEDFAPQAQTLPGTAAVVNAVAKEKAGIGYGGAAYAKGVRELKVKVGKDDVEPTLANIRAGKYPLSRQLFFYLRAKPAGDAAAFIDFCLSDEGQKLVEAVGYFPIK
ncbi:MAG: phosphate ABC transporter substrate-binding protein [Myxococcota bacterium]